MRIGELSEKSGFPVKTLRYYDEIGLVRPSRRGPVSGVREYRDDAIILLDLVRIAKHAGFRLDEVSDILAAARKPSLCRHVLSMLDRRIEEIGLQVAELRTLRERLVQARRGGFDSLRHFSQN